MTMTTGQTADFAALANTIRCLAIDAVETAGHGHPGAAMGMADFATVLYANHLCFDASDPDWSNRDRVVLSNGHSSILLYSLLHLTGVTDLGLDDIKAFSLAGSKTPGHPEVGHTVGVETTTGPLGQGVATAVGMALGPDHRAGDGDLGQLEGDGARVTHHAGPDLDQLQLQAGQRPVGHGLGQFDAAQEGRQILASACSCSRTSLSRNRLHDRRVQRKACFPP
jgi:hypothetical protein